MLRRRRTRRRRQRAGRRRRSAQVRAEAFAAARCRSRFGPTAQVGNGRRASVSTLQPLASQPATVAAALRERRHSAAGVAKAQRQPTTSASRCSGRRPQFAAATAAARAWPYWRQRPERRSAGPMTQARAASRDVSATHDREAGTAAALHRRGGTDAAMGSPGESPASCARRTSERIGRDHARASLERSRAHGGSDHALHLGVRLQRQGRPGRGPPAVADRERREARGRARRRG